MAVSTAQRRPVALAARPALAAQAPAASAAAAAAAQVTATRATPAATTIIAAAVYPNTCPRQLVRVRQQPAPHPHPHPPTIITAAAPRATTIPAPIQPIRARRASAHSGIASHPHCI